MYNEQITVREIPLKAHDYRLGARSTVDWILESSRVKRHKASEIVNDPNVWAEEHSNQQYHLDLLGRVVTVSMKTQEIIESLPAVTF